MYMFDLQYLFCCPALINVSQGEQATWIGKPVCPVLCYTYHSN